MTQKGLKLSRFINLTLLFFSLHYLVWFVRLPTSPATLSLRSLDDNDDDEREGWFRFHSNSKRRQL